jgi:hypothetical protein
LKPARYKGAHGGRGSGKSHFFAEQLVQDCLAEPGMLAVCIREVQKTLAQSSKRLIEDKIAAFGMGAHFRVYSDRIETPGGGLIIFVGMQDHTAESIKSLEGYKRSRVAKFDKDGNFVKSWGERGGAPGDFNTPHSLVVDSNDIVYVADRGNSRIQTFDTDGNRKNVWRLPTAPWSLCLTNGPNQVMFVGSVGRVYKMSLDGKILGVFGRPGRMPGTLDSIHAIACPDEKTVYLANLYASRMDKWVSP